MPGEDILPQDNKDYGTQEYWEQRYERYERVHVLYFPFYISVYALRMHKFM
jgi:hypothetical protein